MVIKALIWSVSLPWVLAMYPGIAQQCFTAEAIRIVASVEAAVAEEKEKFKEVCLLSFETQGSLFIPKTNQLSVSFHPITHNRISTIKTRAGPLA